MGNRGRLHDNYGVIRRLWQAKRWLVGLLEFDGRHRQVMAPDRCTELFFLDEATALAAGHRPCFECRWGAYNAYAWAAGNGIDVTDGRPTAASIDDRLHEERLGPGRSKRTFVEKIDGLPDGVFESLDKDEFRPYLLGGGHLLAWSPGGYTAVCPLAVGEVVSVLTPKSTVAAMRAGYKPEVHPSGNGPWPS